MIGLAALTLDQHVADVAVRGRHDSRHRGVQPDAGPEAGAVLA